MDSLNHKETGTEPFPEINVIVKVVRPFRKWLEDMWAVLRDPKTIVTVMIALTIAMFNLLMK